MSRKAGFKGRSQAAFIKFCDQNKSEKRDPLMISTSVLRQHTQPCDCWIALDSVVFDVSQYLEYHPGGQDEILRYAGKDCTKIFQDIHPWINFKAILGPLMVGFLIPTDKSFQTHKNEEDTTFFSSLCKFLNYFKLVYCKLV